ncbi:UbiA prenyltransferase family protein [Micromonospora endophytica]|uniref:Prenyltransferase n=1 Tax=Micromonospora endophytica TaxID=515350 RepID=A0A2W2CJ37_9ACTN|nr:UbiA prenyltransferase family protein [Micromonospora endophytica]PZF99471.1 prenyltransferase [Micromonospora endophytica]RIW40271.1 prenyltransferase [Micromonospora endophytica]BCJ58137.1 decaprenyl-phosphate phosphoribosyltransferase [Micromonospora endophytica]
MDHALEAPSPPTPDLPVLAVDPSAAVEALRPLTRVTGLLALLRPRQWIKGGLVLMAPVVASPATAVTQVGPLLGTLLSFLAASSAVYVFNDLKDRDRDRLHPVKRNRPLASGRVNTATAIVLLVTLLAVTAALTAMLPTLVGVIVAGYLAINLWYCLALKHQPLVDVSVVSVGFVLRVLAGTVAVGIAVQPALLIAVYCACLALSLGKRRHELAAMAAAGGEASAHRPALRAYSVHFLDQVVVVNLVAALVGYVAFIWVQTPPYGPVTAGLTFPFAAFAVHRYLQMVTVGSSGGDPVEDLIRDRALLIDLGLWAAVLAQAMLASVWHVW